MSAFVVDKAHINAMVIAGLASRDKVSWFHDGKFHELNDDTVDAVGQMLLDENVRAVGERYEDSEITDLPGRTDAEYLIPFEHKLGYPLSVVQVFKLIHCYEYQACEDSEWEKSEAHAFCRALEGWLIRRLPGYEKAEWGWTKWPEETLSRNVRNWR